MYMSYMPSRPADIYTVRISDHEAQTSLAMSLRKLFAAAGGTLMINLTERPGFMSDPIFTSLKRHKLTISNRFIMPTTVPCPLTSYLHGGLLEEGCIHISKTRLEKEVVPQKGKFGLPAVEDDASNVELVEDNISDHPSLRMQWNWTELKKNEAK